jgi:hypothetical protein
MLGFHLADPMPRVFRLSFQMRTLKDAPAPLTHVAASFTYNAPLEAIGVGAPPLSCCMPRLTTQPPMALPAATERLFPGGFASLQLLMPTGRLAATLCDAPLTVTLRGCLALEGEEGAGTPTVLGMARLSLAGLLETPMEKDSTTRVLEASAPVFDAPGGARVASLQCLFFLEDLGEGAGEGALDEETEGQGGEGEEGEGVGPTLRRHRVKLTGTMGIAPQGREEMVTAPGDPQHPQSQHSQLQSQHSLNLMPPTSPDLAMHRHPSLHAALDAYLSSARCSEAAALVAWKREREAEWLASKQRAEAAWSAQCSAAEGEKLKALEAAWSTREATRTAVLVEAQERVREVENRLKRVLAAAEEKLQEGGRVKAEAEAERERGRADLAAAQRRVKEDGEHAIAAARKREAAAEARITEALREVDASKARAAAAEEELAKARASALASPDTCLRDALVSAEGEIAAAREAAGAAQRAAEGERREREGAQAQVLALAGEVERLRAEAEAGAREGEERLRVAFLAREERYVLDGDRATLRSIRRAVDGLREDVGALGAAASAAGGGSGAAAAGGASGAGMLGPPPSAPPPWIDEPPTSTFPAKRPPGSVTAANTTASANSSALHASALNTSSSLQRATLQRGEQDSPLLPAAALETALRQVEAGARDGWVQQLKAGRRQLMASGVGYTASHTWIQRIDKALLAATGGTASRALARAGAPGGTPGGRM